jgi:pilus assembly protein CpaB
MRRVIAVVASLVLAGLGTFLLVRYVQSAEDRALEGKTLVDVLVVEEPIEEGALAEDVRDAVSVVQVPAEVAALGVMSDLAQLEGRVPGVDLVPGEQLVVSRFVAQEEYLELAAERSKVDVPTDHIEVTVSLSPDRAVGGELQPGDIVAVFSSFDPFDIQYVEPSEIDELGGIPVITTTGDDEDELQAPTRTPNSTKIILHKVVVTNVQAEELPVEPSEEEVAPGGPDLAPTGNLLITLALLPQDAERVVFTAEHGRVWLGREGEDADESDTPVQTRASVYEAAYE